MPLPAATATRLARAGISAARITALGADYDAADTWERGRIRALVASRPDEVLRRTYDPDGAASAAGLDPAAYDTDAEREAFVPSRLSAAALRAAYQRPIDVYRHSAAALRHKMETNQDCCWTHIGDSTANGTDEWLRLALAVFATDYPNMRVTHELWNDTTQGYDAATVVQAGNGGAEPEPTFRDTFTRTAASIGGTTTDTGQAWAGSGGSLDGSQFLPGGNLVVTSPHGVDPLATDGLVARCRVIVPAGITTSTYARLYGLTNGAGGSDQIFCEVVVGGSGTTLSLNLYQRIGTAASVIGTGPPTIPISNAAPVTVDLALSIRGKTATATMTSGGVTRTRSATVDQPDGWAGWSAANRRIGLTSTIAGVALDDATVGLNGPAPKTLRVVNGSHPGASTTYLTPRVAALTPVAPDLVTVSTSHNHGTQAVPAFLAAVDELVAAVLARYPDAGVALSSQNPQFTPATAAVVAAHGSRISAIRPHARGKGWGYIAACEPFLRRTDRGLAWVMADGVHPDAANGSPAWRDAALAYLRDTAV